MSGIKNSLQHVILCIYKSRWRLTDRFLKLSKSAFNRRYLSFATLAFCSASSTFAVASLPDFVARLPKSLANVTKLSCRQANHISQVYTEPTIETLNFPNLAAASFKSTCCKYLLHGIGHEPWNLRSQKAQRHPCSPSLSYRSHALQVSPEKTPPSFLLLLRSQLVRLCPRLLICFSNGGQQVQYHQQSEREAPSSWPKAMLL